jgi:hypothetical protein
MKNMSGMSDSIATRLGNLDSQLHTNKPRFMGSILDLENELAKQTEVKMLSWSPINIEEFSDENGRLDDQLIPESTWLGTLSRETGLDCRMILDFKLVKELGLYRWQVLVNHGGKPVTYDLSVWVVPVGDAK